MATYYWVGGAGTWDNASTARWASSSGGAGGAGVPTSADNAIFDTLSNATAYAVTVGTNAVAADITIAGPSVGNVTISAATTALLTCYGSITSAATGVVFSATGSAQITFQSAITGKTITTNGVSLSGFQIAFNSAGGGWTLGSAFSTGGNINVNFGTFNTSSYNLTANSIISTTANVRAITLGSSTVTLLDATPVNIVNNANLTFNAGTSTIVGSASSPTFIGGGLTYYNVSFTAAAIGTTTITGANTFNNLTQTSRSATGQRIVSLAADQTVTGTLTLQTLGTPNPIVRTVVWSSVIGTRRAITAAALSGMADIDFRDIVGAGAASWTGTRIGNLLNNTGITFTAGVNKYWNLAAGGLWSATAWALSAGGAVAAANFPLAQDTVNVDLTTITTGSTINISIAWQVPTVICTRPSGSNTLIMTSGTISPQLYGSWTSCAGMSFTAPTNAWEFVGQGLTQTVTSAGVAFTQGLTVNSPGGTVQLLDALTMASAITHTLGGLDLNSFTLTAFNYNTSSTVSHTLAFGASGKMVLTGNSVTLLSGSGGNLSVTGTAPLIQFTYSGGTGSRNIVMPILVEAQAISVEFLNNATDTVTIQGVLGGYKDITFTSFSGSLTFANTPQIFGNLYVCSGVTGVAGSGTTFAGTTGTTQTITTAGPSPITFEISIAKIGASPLQLQTAVALGTTRSFILTSGTLVLNGFDLSTGQFNSSNSNVRTLSFGTNKIVVTGNTSTVFSIATATNLTLSGTPQVEATYSGSTGSRTFIPGANFASPEANAVSVRVSAGGDIIILETTSSAYGNVEFTSGFTGTVSISNSFPVYGNWSFSPNMVTPTTGTGTLSFASTSATPRTITSNGKAFGSTSINFNGVGGTWQLKDNFTIGSANTATLTNGTFDANNFNVSLGNFNGSNANVRTLALGSGTWTVMGSGTSAWTVATATNLTLTGTASIDMTSASAKTFAGGGLSWNGLNQGGLGTLTISGANTFTTLTNTVQPSTIVFPASTTTTIGVFALTGTSGNLTTLNSSTSGTRATISSNGGTGTFVGQYLSIKDSAATGTAIWTAFPWYGNVDGGNNTGWYFTPPATDPSSGFLVYFEA